MPRILLSAAHIAPLILHSLGVEYTTPALVTPYPSLPRPFKVTRERVEMLKLVNPEVGLGESRREVEK
ncbi:hypothetical protein IFR05_017615, partial [Cadophora sp. M221]